MKKVLSILLASALLMTGLAGCGGGGGGGKAEANILSPENTSAVLKNGVSVDVGSFVLEGETELTVTKQPVEENKDEGYKIEAYDFTLGNMTELSDFITIRIPYDTSYCEDGQDASKCVGAKYKNEATGEWEDVLFEVDAAANELVIYTDHLSTFGAFYVRNEGKRSAYITDVNSYVSGIDQQQAVDALREYVESGGATGEEAVGLAAQILTGYNGFLSGVAGAAGETGFATDLTGTILSIASAGSPTFDTALADSAYKKMGKLGKVAAAVKIGAVMFSTEKTDADTLGLYKDSAMLALSFAESAAWGLAASGLFIFDYTISSMFEQGMAMKMEKIDEVYVYFNDQFSGTLDGGNGWNARSLKDWRQVLIDIAKANPNEADAKTAIEAEIDRYARHFWTLGDMEKAIVVTDIEDKGTKGSVTVPDPTQAEIETLVGAYKAHLYERLYPVIQSVSVYMQRKAESEYLAALGEIKAFYNQIITFNIIEDVPEGEKSQYDGYALRFAPLSENAVKASWSGTLKGAGGASTRFTLLGYLLAGCPTKLQLFPPDADPDNDEPELTLGFKLSAPVTEVTIGGAPTFDELVGSYEDGTMTINSVFISDTLRAELEKPASSEDSGESSGGDGFLDSITDELNEEYAGCDIAGALLGLEEQIGVAKESPFTVSKTGENAGILALNDRPGNVIYDPTSGILNFDMSDAELKTSVSGELRAGYNGDKSGVVLSGELKMTALFPESDFYIIVKLDGSKALKP
ncbi:MAG: hypothetical protein EOM54_10695 [Clostridia bacterium]|nr:hypothetical protein [Clostridia bacterium]